MPGVTLTKWTSIWAKRFPRTPLSVLEVTQAEQRTALDDGRVAQFDHVLPAQLVQRFAHGVSAVGRRQDEDDQLGHGKWLVVSD